MASVNWAEFEPIEQKTNWNDFEEVNWADFEPIKEDSTIDKALKGFQSVALRGAEMSVGVDKLFSTNMVHPEMKDRIKQLREGLDKGKEELSQQGITPERKAEIDAMQQASQTATGTWENVKAGAMQVFDMATHPSEWTIQGSVENLASPENLISFGAGTAVKGASLFSKIGKGAGIGAIENVAVGTPIDTMQAYAQDKENIGNIAMQSAVGNTLAGASLGGVGGAFAKGKTPEIVETPQPTDPNFDAKAELDKDKPSKASDELKLDEVIWDDFKVDDTYADNSQVGERRTMEEIKQTIAERDEGGEAQAKLFEEQMNAWADAENLRRKEQGLNEVTAEDMANSFMLEYENKAKPTDAELKVLFDTVTDTDGNIKTMEQRNKSNGWQDVTSKDQYGQEYTRRMAGEYGLESEFRTDTKTLKKLKEEGYKSLTPAERAMVDKDIETIRNHPDFRDENQVLADNGELFQSKADEVSKFFNDVKKMQDREGSLLKDQDYSMMDISDREKTRLQRAQQTIDTVRFEAEDAPYTVPDFNGFVKQYKDQFKYAGIRPIESGGKVKIFRSAIGDIEAGDWVGLDKEYAKSHSRTPDHKVYEMWVNKEDIRWQGDDANEWIYLPKKIIDKATSENILLQKDANIKGSYTINEKLIKLFESHDVSTLNHELGHRFYYTLSAKERGIIHEIFGVKDGKWETKHHEAFADAYARYIAEGKAPSAGIKAVFDKFTSFMKEILLKLKENNGGKMPPLSKEAKEFFAAVLGNEKARNELMKKYQAKEAMSMGEGELFSKAYHGTPHEVDKFDTAKIGTGEGAQAYGHGLYFADSKEVAEFYRKKLAPSNTASDLNSRVEFIKLGDKKISDFDIDMYEVPKFAENKDTKGFREYAKQKAEDWKQLSQDPDYKFKQYAEDKAKSWNEVLSTKGELVDTSNGNLYRVELKPKEEEYLLWDKPLSEQSLHVREALEKELDIYRKSEGAKGAYINDSLGQRLYKEFTTTYGSEKLASDRLNELGIKGIKYEDGNSRNRDTNKNHNYVIFKNEDVEITGANGKMFDGTPNELFQTARTERMMEWHKDSHPLTKNEDGTPKVFYHGTVSDISEFKEDKIRKDDYDVPYNGFWFSDSKSTSPAFKNPTNIMPVYLNIKNPATRKVATEYSKKAMAMIDALYDENDTSEQYSKKLDDFYKSKGVRSLSDLTRKLLQNDGYDGVLHDGKPNINIKKFNEAMAKGDEYSFETVAGAKRVFEQDKEYGGINLNYENGENITGYDSIDEFMSQQDIEMVAFNPKQIKSVNNRGTFDESNPNILYQRTDLSIGDETIFEKAQRTIQDKFGRVKELVNAKAGLKQIADALNPYLAEELYHGRVQTRLEEFNKAYVEPLVKKIHAYGKTIDDLDKYLHARHAIERNKKMEELNGIKDGSGMSDADASKIIAQYANDAKMKELAQMVYSMNKERLKLMYTEGLESAEFIKKIDSSYDHYVPLKRVMDSDGNFMRTGKGFDIKGKEVKRAKGSKREVESPLLNSILAFNETLIRAEKNNVGKAMVNFAEAYPDSALYEVSGVKHVPQYDKNGDVVSMNPNYKLADNVLHVKVDGKVKEIVFNDPLLARAFKNLSSQQMGGVMQLAHKLVRYLASINTQYNPEFVFANFERDIQSAMINLPKEVKGNRATMMKNVFSAIDGIHRSIYERKDNEWSLLFKEMKREGGTTGWIEQYKVPELKGELETIIKKYEGKIMPKQAFLKVLEHIDNINTAVENGSRLVAYKMAKESGLTNKRSASIAKNLTVNFNRKGEIGQVMNLAYMFFNASVQGTARMMQAIASSRTVQGALGATVGLSAGLAMYNIGQNEDAYKKIPQYEKDTSLFIMKKDGSYYKVKIPYGYNVFKSMGDVIAEASTDNLEADKIPARLFGIVLSAFSPIGTAPTVAQMVTPTLARPMVDLEVNKNFAGQNISPEGNPFSPTKTPDSYNYFKSVSKPAKEIAQGLNSLTGGTALEKGAIDVSPETLEHLFEFATGGVGKFLNRSAKTATGNAEPNEMPFVRTFYGKPHEKAGLTIIYDTFKNSATEKFSDKQMQTFNRMGMDAVNNGQIDIEKFAGMMKTVNNNQNVLAWAKKWKVTSFDEVKTNKDALIDAVTSGVPMSEIKRVLKGDK